MNPTLIRYLHYGSLADAVAAAFADRVLRNPPEGLDDDDLAALRQTQSEEIEHARVQEQLATERGGPAPQHGPYTRFCQWLAQHADVRFASIFTVLTEYQSALQFRAIGDALRQHDPQVGDALRAIAADELRHLRLGTTRLGKMKVTHAELVHTAHVADAISASDPLVGGEAARAFGVPFRLAAGPAAKRIAARLGLA